MSDADFLRSRKSAIKRAVRLLVMVALGLAVTLVASTQSQRWLVYRYTHDFESLPADQKRTRLYQVADLGAPAIVPLVNALADGDDAVARTAYDLLRDAQQQWTVLGRDELRDRHTALVQQLKKIAIQLPDDRTGWGTNLLQSTVQLTVDTRDESSRLLYKQATETLDRLALSDRAGPSILTNKIVAEQPLEPGGPRRLQVRNNPLPVTQTEPLGQGWTDWPPAEENRSQDDPAAKTPPRETDSIAEGPSVYKSSAARLQPVAPGQTVTLQDIDSGIETRQVHEVAVREVAPQASDAIQSVVHLVDAPMDGLDDRSVIHWLGSEHPKLRAKATSELQRRGYGAHELTIATQLASRDRTARLELIDVIAHDPRLDPRHWLLMLLRDESRDVKLKTVSVLGTMNDPDITARLRSHLVRESDTHVAARIRRVLSLH